MSWHTIKPRRADTLFSLYLRKKRGYVCEKCARFFPGGKGLTVSHFHGRRKESVRFDEENCDILCIRCHQYFESHKTEYEVWKKKQLGERKFDLLTLYANTTKKRDDKLQCMILKVLMKELG
jgi:5-methylcytosine-specific restriction endonuclease McrA